MYLKELTAKNFRNYYELNLKFSPSLNFITGNNGVGKTNILEIVSVLSGIKSFKNVSDLDIIKWGCDFYFCSAFVCFSEEACTNYQVGCSIDKGKARKKIKIDSYEIKKASEYFGRFLTVVFLPSDINIINGTPEIRRRFFDSIMCKLNPQFLDTLNDFKKVLSSRNRILKDIKDKKISDVNQLSVWDNMFTDLSFDITQKRKMFIDQYNEIFINSYEHISGLYESPDIVYFPSIKINEKSDILNQLNERRFKDIALTSTSMGPQRDDFLFLRDGINFVNYASQGQKRTASIALRIAENELIEKQLNCKSILLVDDIFSELDDNRKQNMVSILSKGNQVIFTMVHEQNMNISEDIEIKRITLPL